VSQYISTYYDLESCAEAVRNGRHRELVGGLWEQIGQLQFDYIRNRGLTPDVYVLDVGCGCLRGGVHFIDFLDAGHYFGIDISQDLMDAGYDVELGKLDLQHKLPRENLSCNGTFDATQFRVVFDVAIAQSLFTHLPLNHIKLCLSNLAEVVHAGGILYATYWRSTNEQDWPQPITHPPAKIVTYPDRNSYHYCDRDLEYCTENLPWKCDIVGGWDHPRGQSMAIFTRLHDPSS